jgi:UDPglucose 6-dehydrogenase
MAEAARLLPEVHFTTTPYDACRDAHAAVLMTEWNEYRALDLMRLKELMAEPNFVDLRNVYPSGLMKERGFNYYSVGRLPVR